MLLFSLREMVDWLLEIMCSKIILVLFDAITPLEHFIIKSSMNDIPSYWRISEHL
jgi:hypothetical protein